MKYIDEYRNPEIAKRIIENIFSVSKDLPTIKIMEVCGTHTMSIFRNGIKGVLPENINLVSGPGCPVCVSSNDYIDKLIALSKMDNTIITTFGDMLKVPGSYSSLEKEKGIGADIRIVYSAWDSIKICNENKDKNVIFAAVGFETTIPGTAITVKEAQKAGTDNFYILSSQKIIPPAMRILSENPDLKIDGFLCPAHVSTIIGAVPYRFLSDKFQKACVVTGFEPLDILQGILMIVQQIKKCKFSVEIQYNRVVKKEGNKHAYDLIYEVFEETDVIWRGIGVIENSGLKLKDKFRGFDAEESFDIIVDKTLEPKGCICGLILQGIKEPTNCKLFRKLCTPENPVGACMVSTEGTCSAYYKYS
ncbi:hydrogenase formation protein HypD [candidate division KSB1 bacterium]